MERRSGFGSSSSLGAGKVGVDWTTGEISYHIFLVRIWAWMGAELYGVDCYGW